MAKYTRTLPRWALASTLPGAIGISRQTFRDVEEWIGDNANSIDKLNYGTDLIVRLLVLTTKGFAQEKTMGPVAPTVRSVPALANRIPVQRITGQYFAGWTQRRLAAGIWMLYNDTRAAYVVEFGIGQKVRRPILQMSVLNTLRFISTTQTGERFVDWVMAPRRNPKGQFQSFETRMSGSPVFNGNSNLAGPQGPLP